MNSTTIIKLTGGCVVVNMASSYKMLQSHSEFTCEVYILCELAIYISTLAPFCWIIVLFILKKDFKPTLPLSDIHFRPRSFNLQFPIPQSNGDGGGGGDINKNPDYL